MLPMVDDEVLEANPRFARLYAKLTTEILNPDGSTRRSSADAQAQETLDQHRLQAHKRHLILHALTTLAPPASPPTLRALVVALAPLLSSSLPASTTALLLSHPPLSHLPAHLDDLAALVSASLHSSALALARLAHPCSPPSLLHRHIPSLATDYAALDAALSSARHDLQVARARTLAAAARLLATHTQSLSLLVRTIESKHGVVARGLQLAATHVSLEAQQAEAEAVQLSTSIQNKIYTPNVVEALQHYSQHLQHVKSRLVERIDGLQAQMQQLLDESGVDEAEHDELKKLAAQYCDLKRQIDEAMKDMEQRRDE
ncbi:hypothetical protein CDD81_6725 [Ophiocordyceps australis]|uniref:Uncharacterized protein n=1 Tax=Ophiocordyceps australis TaxID=1399860 RepID=A0A2C5Y225_9HYPO|nr:hypothetical protein CDD81_6725 [Ophiocordyceps australis]